jgi:hypothetical protein
MIVAMIDVDTSELKKAVESQHGGAATFTGRASANGACDWSSPIEGGDKRRFFAVLHVSPITSPLEVMRAAIVAESRSQKE